MDVDVSRTPPEPSWRQQGPVLAFVVCAGMLAVLWTSLPEAWREEWVVHRVTVRPVASVLGLFLPDDAVVAVGDRLAWPGGALRLRNGCDGMDVLLLYLAALLSAGLSRRRLLVGLTLGVLVLWSMNQVRLVLLYASFRHRPDWFDALHSLWGPALLLGAAVCLYRACSR